MLKEKINKGIINAMKEKDAKVKGTLQLLKASIQNEEIKSKEELSESAIIALIKGDIKRSNELIVDAKKQGRDDIVQDTERVIAALNEFLPTMLTEEQILQVLKDAGAEKGMPQGKLMGLVMSTHKDVVNGADVNKVVRENFL